MEDFFQTIQKACLPGVWSKGVQLARSADSVVLNSRSDDEILLRVRVAEHPVSRKVTLWPEDEDWFCDCQSATDVCLHVVAALLFLRNAKTSSPSHLSGHLSGPVVAQVQYRFTRSPGGLLHFERWIVQGDQQEILTNSLVSQVGGVTSGRVRSLPIAATQADYAVDYILNEQKQGEFSGSLLLKLFRGLSECENVFLDGSLIQVSSQPLKITVEVLDEARGFRLRQVEETNIIEKFKNGAVLSGHTLKGIELPVLTAEEHQWLSGKGTYFSSDQAAVLVKEILPALERKLVVRIGSQKLPQLEQIPPRVVLDLMKSENGKGLWVTPRITYGESQVFLKDVAAEKGLARQLQESLRLTLDQTIYFEGSEAVAFCVKAKAWETKGDGFKNFSSVGVLSPHFRLDDTHFDFSFQVEGSTAFMGGEQVIQAWRENQNYISLMDGKWAALPQEWFYRYGDRVAALLAHRESRSQTLGVHYQVLEAAQLCDEMGIDYSDRIRKLKAQLEHANLIENVSLPSRLTASLRAYQQTGVNWLCRLREAKMGALLADDMGLGKTLQTLCAVRGRTLIVTPTSVLPSWTQQIQQFRPDLSFQIYHGGDRVLSDAQVVVTTYSLLRLDRQRLFKTQWETIVLDEAQTIKNPQSQVAQAAHHLQAEFRIALSGTPIENRLEDLWSQFQFINPGWLGPLADFKEMSREEMQRKIKPFILRRLKKDVAPELPLRTEINLYCELGAEEREVYDSVLAASRKDVMKKLEAGGSVFAILELLLRLRQACCHGALVPGARVSGSVVQRSAKVDLLIQTLEASIALGHRALVFSQWTSYLDLIEPCLVAQGISFSRLDGSTINRKEVVEEFQSSSGPSVMLISLKAGGMGLTLTAADHVFLMDPWWNPTVEDQAADRAHRIGQTNPVLIHRLVASGTIEERILDLQKFKVNLASSILQEASDSSLTREDLLALLS